MVFITLLKTLNGIAKKLTILKALSIEGAFDDSFICNNDLYRISYDSIGRYLLRSGYNENYDVWYRKIFL